MIFEHNYLFIGTNTTINSGRLQNTNDIKRWASVVSDIDDIQSTDESNTAETTENTAPGG